MIGASQIKLGSRVLWQAKVCFKRGSSSFKPSVNPKDQAKAVATPPSSIDTRELDLNSPPTLFIQRYKCLIDIDEVPLIKDSKNKNDIPSDPSSQIQRKINHVATLARDSSTFEGLAASLKEKTMPSFDHRLSDASRISDNAFVDEEVIRNMSQSEDSNLRLKTDQEADILEWSETKLNLSMLPSYYLMLSKSRLTLLVCITSAAGFCLAPVPVHIPNLLWSTLGVAFIASSANSVNQYMEVPFDSQMNRTKNRVLVRGRLSSLHAMSFASVTAISGTCILASQVNGLAASLGLINLFLYTCVYTPMKRVSIANTWVGSVVGALPPLIGWTSATGALDSGALILAAILYAWQFPHFNSLSWNLRPDYSKAGYRMMSVTDPDLCRRVALRYSLGCIGICTAAPLLEVTTWAFAADSLPLNLYLVFLSWKFYQNADSSSSRKLFRYTLIHLPLLMTLMFLSKTSLA